MSRCPQFCTFENAGHTCVRCGLPPRDPRMKPEPEPHTHRHRHRHWSPNDFRDSHAPGTPDGPYDHQHAHGHPHHGWYLFGDRDGHPTDL